MMTHSISNVRFKDTALQASFEQSGFATIRLLDGDTLAKLSAVFNKVNPCVPPGFFSSVLQAPMLRQQVHTAISDSVRPALDACLSGFRIVLASTVSRSPGSDRADLPLHQDWSFVDENHASSVSVWIPLQDVTQENGCMQLVPGSHLHEQPLRRIGSGFRYASIEDQLRESYLQDIPLVAGEALFFDHRLIHGSHANTSAFDRKAIGAVLLPVDIPLHMGCAVGKAIEFTDRVDEFLLSADLTELARRKL